MRSLIILIATALLICSGITASAQSSAQLPPELGIVPYPGPAGAGAASTTNGTNPYATAVAPRKNVANPYLNEANPSISTVTPRHNPPTAGPGESAAAGQSGINKVQARVIIEQQGYTRIGEIQAEPNSIWVWQADAIKDGRRVRIGIDYRGNLLELGGGARPCAAPGAGLGPVSPLGTGMRLYESSSCSNR